REPAQLVEARQLALGGAKRLKPVERWNARARLLNVEPRIREIEPAACRADREAQRKTFGRDPVLLSLHSLETLAERSLRVEHDGVFDDFSGKELFGQTRSEDYLETGSSGRFHRTDKTASVAAPRRRDSKLEQSRRQNHLNFVQVYRSYGRHRLKLREEFQDLLRIPERCHGQTSQMVNPLAPACSERKRRK